MSENVIQLANHEPRLRQGSGERSQSGQPVPRRSCMPGGGVSIWTRPEIPTLALPLISHLWPQ